MQPPLSQWSPVTMFDAASKNGDFPAATFSMTMIVSKKSIFYSNEDPEKGYFSPQKRIRMRILQKDCQTHTKRDVITCPPNF